MSQHWSEILRKNGACSAAVEFASHFKTLKEAWGACRSGIWMTWLLCRVDSSAAINSEQAKRILGGLRSARMCRTCNICVPRLAGVDAADLKTWGDLFRADLDSSFECAGANAIRRIFPNPPRFRNGAGE